MMQIVYFARKDQFLTELESLEGEVTFVTPSPLKADGLRARLPANLLSADVITIAKFTAEIVNVLWEGDAPKVKRKADLLLMFGILKNRYFPELGYEQFIQAYNFFSDLRSFTLNEEALSSVMEEQAPEIRKTVSLFWQLLDVTGFVDEHGAYQKITEALRSSEERDELNKTWVIWGFQHLNGQQVDLLKALAIRYRVVVPFPLSLKDKIKKSDWISWLKDAQVTEVDLDELPESPRGNWLRTNSREHARKLQQLLRDGDQVVLGVSKLAPLHTDFVPSLKVSYKIPHQIINAELREIAEELKEKLKSSSDPLDLSAELRSLIVPGAFKRLKAIQLYEDALKTISELTDEAVSVDAFFLKLLADVVSLNQPRTSFVPMSSTDLTIDLKDMSGLEDADRNRRIILCIDERFEDIQGLGQSYPESIQKSLASLGPLKRNELELLFRQWEFNDVFSRGEVLVLMSEGTLKHSLVWKRLFSGVTLETVNEETLVPQREIKDHFRDLPKRSFEGSLSASKFQTFVDCPRKFYFSYVDKVFPSIALEKDFDSLVSGTIIHKIIEVYHERRLSPEALPALTVEIMESFIRERNLELTPETYRQRQLIFGHRALNGINFVRDLAAVIGEPVTWTMEEGFDFTTDYRLTGKIDCVGVSDRYIFLLDFKSTKFSASSFKEVEEFESLQLWTYALAASKKIENFDKKNIVMGYVVLDNPVESNLLLSDEGLALRLKDARLCKQKAFKEGLAELLKLAEEKLLSVSLAIKAEKDFPAVPRKANACHFCELTKVCVKNGMNHVES